MRKELEAMLRYFCGLRTEYAQRPPIGRRTEIRGTECYVHMPKRPVSGMPVLFEIHGGAWIGCDAVLVGSLCETIADAVPCIAVNINYKKLDVCPYPYQAGEVCRVLSYFREHAAEYGADPERFVLCGQSAGAQIAAGSALMARDRSIRVARQILVYPATDFSGRCPNPIFESMEPAYRRQVETLLFGGMSPDDPYLSPAAAPDDRLAGVAPADIVLCGEDVFRPHGEYYAERLTGAGVPVTVKVYENAVHGFLEVCRPDNPPDPGQEPGAARGEEQAALARDCEQYLTDILRRLI